MPVVPKSFSYAQKKYPSEARNKSGKQLISCNSKRQIIERTEKQNASSRYFNSSRAHHAAEGKFDEPIGSAGNRPQGGLCKPPARPVVMIVYSECEFELLGAQIMQRNGMIFAQSCICLLRDAFSFVPRLRFSVPITPQCASAKTSAVSPSQRWILTGFSLLSMNRL